MSKKAQFEIFIQTLTEMVEAQRRPKDPERRHPGRVCSDRAVARPMAGTARSLRPSSGLGDARGPQG